MKNNSAQSFVQSGQFTPVLVPLGDCGLLVRFGTKPDPQTNASAVLAGKILARSTIVGVLETCPSLVSVYIHYDPFRISFLQLCQQVRMALALEDQKFDKAVKTHHIEVIYGDEKGPDLIEVSKRLDMSPKDFVEAHNCAKLHVMAIGFAPGFTYCGLHTQELHIPRRKHLHASVPPGSIIFAAGQTAITATDVPTGWHVIGRTSFRNFDPALSPPTQLSPGDRISFSGKLLNDQN